jgi:hypothetical protein
MTRPSQDLSIGSLVPLFEQRIYSLRATRKLDNSFFKIMDMPSPLVFPKPVYVSDCRD